MIARTTAILCLLARAAAADGWPYADVRLGFAQLPDEFRTGATGDGVRPAELHQALTARYARSWGEDGIGALASAGATFQKFDYDRDLVLAEEDRIGVVGELGGSLRALPGLDVELVATGGAGVIDGKYRDAPGTSMYDGGWWSFG